MHKTFIAKFGWIVITSVIISLLVVGIFPIASKLNSVVYDIVGVQGKEMYTVELDANGGELSQDMLMVIQGEVYGYLPVPTKTGSVFAGWYTDETYSVRITSETICTKTSEHMLHALWT